MKGKRGIFFILVLLVLAGLLYWQFFLKKKPGKKGVRPTKPRVAQRLEESPRPVVLPPGAPPALRPPPSPEASPRPTRILSSPSPSPSASVSPSPLFPRPSPTPRPGLPETIPAEARPQIEVVPGKPIRIAEGSTFSLDQMEVNYGGTKPLQYHWELIAGPKEKIEIQGASQLKPRLVVGNLDTPTAFLLRFTVNDGVAEGNAELPILAVPAQLQWVGRTGGPLLGVKHLGDKWVVARGSHLEIFSPEMNLLNQILLDFPIQRFFSMVDPHGLDTIYVQSTEGNWTVVQLDPASGYRLSKLPMMGRDIRAVVPFRLSDQPFVFALLEKNVELWNLSEPRRPRIKSSLATQLRSPSFLAFFGHSLFVADEDSLETLEFSTGNLVASIPSGGSLTSLQTYSLGNKHYLLASIGRDRTGRNRQDYGLRILEILSNGRLGEEKRVKISEGLPVEKALVIPGVDQALLSVWGKRGLELRIFDLKTQKELPLKFAQEPNFLALSELETGKIGGNPVAVLADGNQLRVFTFQAEGSPVTSYNAKELINVPGLLNAGWVKARADGSLLWVGDDGTLSAGSLAWVDGTDLKVKKNFNTKGLFPVAGDFKNGGDAGLVLYLTSDPTALPPESSQGSLGLVSLDPKSPEEVNLSKPFLGVQGTKGESRPLGVSGRVREGALWIGVALSHGNPTSPGSGLVLLKKASAVAGREFLKGNLGQASELIPFQDARDVAFTLDGQGAFLAAGLAGVIGVDLTKKTPVSQMSLNSKEWLADRVTLSPTGQMILASFVHVSTGQAIVKIFGIKENLQMEEYGTVTGLMAVSTPEGLRAPGLALTEDDLYLFVPLQKRELAVMNLSNPVLPFKVAGITLPGDIRDVSVANKFRDIFVALGREGISKLQFDFPTARERTSPAPETQPSFPPASPGVNPPGTASPGPLIPGKDTPGNSTSSKEEDLLEVNLKKI